MNVDDVKSRIPIEFGDYTLIKVYPNFALYTYKGIWNTCFNFHDLGLTTNNIEMKQKNKKIY